MNPIIERATVTSLIRKSERLLEITLAAPQVAAMLRPGQFVLLNSERNSTEVLSQVLLPGVYGTKLTANIESKMSSMQSFDTYHENDILSILGPLGTSFSTDDCAEAVLFADAVSERALHSLALRGACSPENIITVPNSPTEDFVQLLIDRITNSSRVLGAGDSDLFDRIRSRIPASTTFQYLFSDCEIACGIGTCVACAKELADGTYSRPCTAGLVYDASAFA